MLNVFCLAGRLTEMPQLKETPGGIRMAEVQVEVQRPYANAQGIYENDLITLEVWRGLAETICNVCQEGSWVTARGRIASRPYEKDGKVWHNYSFVAEKLDVLS